MTCFTRAKASLQEHESQFTHKKAMEDSMVFMGQMESGHLSLQQQLQNQASATVQKTNKAILKSILKAIIFCGKQRLL